jgi:hypothetical protein
VRLVGAGLLGALFWGVAGLLLGGLVGAVGYRRAPAVCEAGLFGYSVRRGIVDALLTRGRDPCRPVAPSGRVLAVAGGALVGASTGFFCGFVAGGLTGLSLPGPAGWVIDGGLLGFLLTGLFGVRPVLTPRPNTVLGPESTRSAPPRGTQVLGGLVGAAGGAGLWLASGTPGGLAWWVPVGAAIGALTAYRVARVLE